MSAGLHEHGTWSVMYFIDRHASAHCTDYFCRTMLLAMAVIIVGTVSLMISRTHSLVKLFAARAASMGGYTVLFIVTPEVSLTSQCQSTFRQASEIQRIWMSPASAEAIAASSNVCHFCGRVLADLLWYLVMQSIADLEHHMPLLDLSREACKANCRASSGPAL